MSSDGKDGGFRITGMTEDEFATEIGLVVREAIDRAVKPILERLDTLEKGQADLRASQAISAAWSERDER
ncbi:hypothetical protein [Inquilinus limosus]|uniref:hypothetical protein n=1 Tax=Inquilinus limosus TaxID=171674 RepID=UPI000422ECD1|nr:hypothetical protein [Inquilinus limosus]